MSSQAQHVWLITGCSAGFGAALAHEILARGDLVIATARDVSKISALEALGMNVLTLDVTSSPNTLKKVADDAQSIFGRIDYLVNNAGYAAKGTIEETTPEAMRAQFDTNVFGMINVTRAFLPHFRRQRSGVIANVSSTAAWQTAPSMGLYSASKAAASVISETMTGELADFGIHVCTIEPGAYRSKLLSTEGQQQSSQNQIADYEETTARRVAAMIDQFDGFQPGDINKGVKVIVDVLTDKTKKGIPARLVLGSDGYSNVRSKCEAVLKTLDEWEDITTNTDIEA